MYMYYSINLIKTHVIYSAYIIIFFTCIMSQAMSHPWKDIQSYAD